MSDLVDRDDIERIVGAERHLSEHYGRAVSAVQTVYVLHSVECLDSGRDLRACVFSRALDRGINPDEWTQDQAVRLTIIDGRLVGR